MEPTFVVANAKAYKKEHEDQALRQLPNSGCNFELTPIFIDNERRDPKKAWFTIGAVHLPDGFFMNWTGTQQGEGSSTIFLPLPSVWRCSSKVRVRCRWIVTDTTPEASG